MPHLVRKQKLLTLRYHLNPKITTVVKDSKGAIIEGHPDEIKKQKDTWVFTKNLSDKSPVWFLKSTL